MARIRQIEDRNAISERVINYARAIDRTDSEMLGACPTDIVHIDFSEAGMPANDFARADFVAFARSGLNGFTALQHFSPNHVIEFVAVDPDRAICYSYVYAQHRLTGSPGGVSGYDVAETTDENPERVALVQQLTAAYLRTALYPDDSSWPAASRALLDSPDPMGRLESE